jgi:hypothetical protein
VLLTPCKTLRLTGQEHGRAIPLTVIREEVVASFDQGPAIAFRATQWKASSTKVLIPTQSATALHSTCVDGPDVFRMGSDVVEYLLRLFVQPIFGKNLGRAIEAPARIFRWEGGCQTSTKQQNPGKRSKANSRGKPM